MSLAMISKNASYEFRWRRWALLRDVVVTHLEGAKPGSRYEHFARIGRALGVQSVRIPAAPLAAELREIREGLAKLAIEDLVIGPITAGVLYPTVKLEEARPLTQAELAQIAPVASEKTLDQYFASMLDSMLEVCSGEQDMIEVHDG